jgi:hypothetical protein
LWIIFHQAPQNLNSVISNFSKIRGDIRQSRCIIGVNDTDGKVTTSVNDTGKFATVSLTLVANTGNNIGLPTP